MTYQNLGYWVGQANDTSTGSHPSGWTNGQRWSETAGEWLAMFNTSQSQLGQSQTDLANMTNDRNYWKTTVAHDDPNVWTNRYNAGYAAADVAESPRAWTETSFSIGNVGGNDNWQNTGAVSPTANPFGFGYSGNTITINKAGYYVVRMRGSLYGGNWGWGGGIRILLNGGEWVRRDGTLYGGAAFDACEPGNFAAGWQLAFQCKSHGAGAYGQGQFSNGACHIWFVPTPGVAQ